MEYKARTMRSKIQRTLTLILFITLTLAFAIVAWLVYDQTFKSMQAEVQQETAYIQKALELAGNEYLRDVRKINGENRITLINRGGNVLYDTIKDETTMQNHKDRREVKAASRYGQGEDIRLSDTLGKKTYYYAVLMDSGYILRVAKTTDSVFSTVAGVVPYIIGIGVTMLLFAWLLGKWQTSRLIKPINELNLENPLENDVYEELTPLLKSMDKKNREKEEAAQMRKEFSANVSHELKTPLTSISGYAEIMKNGLVKQEDMQGFSERIFNEASRLITLVEDIIKLSKLDEENVELEKEDVDMYFLAREICTRLSPQAEKKCVRFEVSGELVTYRGIRQILDEMLYNIIENAIKYNRENGYVKIWVGHTLSGPKVIVEDSGIGIPKDQQERVFERFYRVDKSHSKESGGTGLGLSIVKHGAHLHHAVINLESDIGFGTKIELLFQK